MPMEERSTTAILLFAHGSRVEEANEGVRELARKVQAQGPYAYVRAAFLELAQPDLDQAIAQAVEAGARRVIVIPHFLTMGLHIRRDLPNLVAPAKQKYPGLDVQVGPPLEGHPLMPSIVLARVRQILAGSEETR